MMEMDKINKDWRDYLKKERLRKLLTFSKEGLYFLENAKVKKVWKWQDKRNINFGTATYLYKVENLEIIFTFEKKEVIFYKLSSASGESINKHYNFKKSKTSKGDEFYLKLTEQEKKIIIDLIEEYHFERFIN